jgi:hypothetical protein
VLKKGAPFSLKFIFCCGGARYSILDTAAGISLKDEGVIVSRSRLPVLVGSQGACAW